ncbi:hypothetical protein G7Y79_00014g037000 [Physcia stellaris]|nr:hypothetical protein G7Y79_00014g037000 [Physcia stellaris]
MKFPYEALSYYWGTDPPRHAIWIRDSSAEARREIRDFQSAAQYFAKSKRFYIRSNLHAALTQFREHNRDVYLWIDALCIDQSQEEEKNHQVSMMSRIYSKAEHVLIWLGAGDTKSDRRWVVQELALASDVTVHYNDKTIHWRDFADAVAVFDARFDDIERHLKTLRQTSAERDFVGDIEGYGAKHLINVTNNVFRRSVDLGRPHRREGDHRTRLLSHEALMAMLLRFEASDPRDTVYALFSIAKPKASYYSGKTASQDLCPIDLLKPDYNKSIVEVFRDFVHYCVETSGSIDIICRHWAPTGMKSTATVNLISKQNTRPKRIVKMPSWVALLKKASFGDPEDGLNGRVNANSLVGDPDQKVYNACGGKLADYSFTNIDMGADTEILLESEITAVNPRLLGTPNPKESSLAAGAVNAFFINVEGFQIDTIHQVSGRIADGLLLRECLVMGGLAEPYTLDPKGIVPDKLWRTLVAGKDPNGKNPPSWYHRACLQCLAQSTVAGDINTSTLIGRPWTPSLVVEFLRRVQSVVWQRIFIESSVRRFFGLAPNEARVGDMICILYGCSVPVILREIKDRSTQEILHYELIGESYIYGLMDGEAVEDFLPPEGSKSFKLG